MSDVPRRSDLDGMVDRYLGELDHALARLPASRRDQLVGEIREHIAELRAERPARDASDMEALLNRVGLPEDIAAVALEDIEPPDDAAMVGAAPDDAATVGAATAGAPTFPVPFAAVPASPRPLAALFTHPRRAGLVGVAVAVAVVLVVGIASITATNRHGVVNATSTPSGSSKAPTPHAPARVTVPDVVGQSEAQAMVTLQSLELLGTVLLLPSSTSAPGLVVSQSPTAGSSVVRRSTVTVDVSSGPSSGTT
jgi:hypothetical protein